MPKLSTSLSVDLLREGKYYIAYAPALDLSAYGETLADAKKAFEETLDIFLEHLSKAGTFEEELVSLGWEKNSNQTLTPPAVVASQTIKMPDYVT